MSLSHKQVSNRINPSISFRFAISDSYTISFDTYTSVYKFDELERIVKRNFNYWKSISEDDSNTFFILWKDLNDKVNSVRNYFSNAETLEINEVNSYLYNTLTYSIEERDPEKKVYIISLESPIDEDKEFCKIKDFVSFYMRQNKENLAFAVGTYIDICNTPYKAGTHLSNATPYSYYPALYFMRQNFSNTTDYISDFESNRLTPLSNRLHEIECDADKQYEDITTLVEKKHNAIQKLFDDKVHELNEFQNAIETWKDGKEKKINDLEETYKNKLKLEAPEKLWRDRAEEHQKSAKCWSLGLILASVALIIASAWFIIVLHNYSLGNLKEAPFISRSFILVSVISFFIYVVRVLIKIVLSNHHLATEYRQKAALTRFYQSLTYEGTDIDKDERLIIMNALFSRVDTGLVKVDGSNDNDALLALLSKNIK